MIPGQDLYQLILSYCQKICKTLPLEATINARLRSFQAVLPVVQPHIGAKMIRAVSEWYSSGQKGQRIQEWMNIQTINGKILHWTVVEALWKADWLSGELNCQRWTKMWRFLFDRRQRARKRSSAAAAFPGLDEEDEEEYDEHGTWESSYRHPLPPVVR